MQETTKIIHYVLVPEIDTPTEFSGKFINSDKPSTEVNLGSNNSIAKIISEATTNIGNALFQCISKP
jgi:hypothetical protein